MIKGDVDQSEAASEEISVKFAQTMEKMPAEFRLEFGPNLQWHNWVKSSIVYLGPEVWLVRGWLAIVQTGEMLTPAGAKYWPEQGVRAEGEGGERRNGGEGGKVKEREDEGKSKGSCMGI